VAVSDDVKMAECDKVANEIHDDRVQKRTYQPPAGDTSASSESSAAPARNPSESCSRHCEQEHKARGSPK
jgi:hypothetical protein